MKKHLQLLALITAMCLPWVGQAQSRATVTVGTGSSTSHYSPFNAYYKNSTNQTIYLASEISTAGTIDTIWFYCAAAQSFTCTELKVYMGLTSASAFGNMFTSADLEEVYSGTNVVVGGTIGWYGIPLDTPFAYNGSDNLVVCVTKKTTSYNQNCTWNYTSMTNRNRYRQNDSDASYGELSSLAAGTAGTTSTYFPNTRFSFNLNYVPPTCLRPVSITADNVTAHGAAISWVDTAATGNYYVYYYPTDNPSAIDSVAATDTSYTLNGLLANTPYTVGVAANCGGGDISQRRVTSFRTECDLINTFPYTYGFEDSPSGTGSVPPCWTFASDGSGTYTNYYPYVNTSNVRTGSKDVYFYLAASSSTTAGYPHWEVAALPPVDTTVHPISDLTLNFWGRTSTTASYVINFEVGVMTNPADTNTFQLVQAFGPYSNIPYQEFNINFANFTGHGNYIAIKMQRGSTAQYLYADDFTLLVTPACPRVEDVVATNITSNSADLSWTEMGTASMWRLDVMNGDSLESTQYANDTNYTLLGLQPNTEYTVNITVECGSEQGGVNTISFRTACEEITDLPYSYGFEDATGSGATNSISSCFGRYTNSSTAYPYPSNSQKHTGSYAVYFYNSASGATYSYLTMPLFAQSVNGMQISFWGYKTSANYGHILVGVMDNPADITTFDTIATLQVSALSTWEYFEIPLASYTGTGRYITLLSTGSTASYTYVDDIVVDRMSDCPRPTDVAVTNITTNSIDLSWSENGTAGAWLIEYSPTSFDNADDIQSVEAYTNPYTLDGLNPSVNYQIRIASLCSDGDTSTYTFFSASTLCGEVSLPFAYTFENDATGTSAPFPNCWTRINDATGSYTYYPYVYSSTNAHSGSKLLYFYQSTTTTYAANQYAVLPPINTTDFPMAYNEMTFWSRMSTAAATGELIVGVMTDPNNVSTFVPVDTIITTGSTYVLNTVDFSNYTDTGKYIALRARRLTTSVYTYVDDIEVRQAASCPTPENVHTVNVLADEATVAWDDDDLFDYAMVYYGTAGFNTDTAQSIYVADTNQVTFTSLMPNTEYEYYVVATCAMGDANPTPRYSFLTTCAAIPADSLPYMEDFESYGTGTSATIDPCWTKYYSNTGTSTSYPYPYGTTPATGDRSLYFYSSASYYSYAALPMFESDINALRVRFNLKTYSTLSTSYGTTLVVGVMSSPNDLATFDTVEVVTFDMNNAVTNTVYPCEVSFDGYTGQGRYIAFLAPLTGPLSYTTNYAKLDDVIVDSVPDCRRCYNLVAENVTANSADLVWQNTSGNLTSYTVALSTTPNFNPDTCTNLYQVYDTIYNLSGLANYSQYYWTVRANCGGDSSDWTLINSFRTLFDCGDNYVNILDTIGDGTSSTSTYTMYTSTSYPSGYSANLFTVAELAEMGLTSNNNINAISLHTGATGGLVQNVRIYMSETSYEGFTTSTPATDTAELFSGMTLVYQGDVTFAANQWNEIVFDTPFHYSGSNNLFVRLVRGNSAAAVSHYYTSTTPDYSTVYGYRSATGSTYTATRSYYRTNMAFNVCAEIPACERPTNVALTSLQPTGCAITWHGATPSYEVAYGPEGFNPDTVASLAGTHANTVDTTFAIAGLNPQTSYDVYVRGFCSTGDTSDWAIALNFATPCAAQTLPYTEDFETYTSGSANPISPCWTKGTNNSTQYPYPYTTNAINGNLSLYFYAYHPSSATSTAYYCYAALPLMDAPVDTLMLTFDMRRYSTTSDSYTSRLVVGVMVDPNDISTFQPVDTIDLKSEAGLSVHRIEVAFNNYTGNGSYIALYDEVPPLYGTATASYSYVYVDDILVDYIPSCYTPVDLYADNVTATTADIHWTDRNSNVYGWELEYGPSGFTQGTGTVVYPVADSITLTGLVNATYYDVYVRNICSPTDTSNWTNACTFSTVCGMINTLPYSNDFENEVAGGASVTTYPTFVNCWTRYNNSTSASYQGYPFVSSTASYIHEGNRCMYFYAAATSTTTAYPDIQMAILPQIDTTLIPVNTLSLNFWARRNASYPATTFYIGVMSDPTDASTFQCVDSLTPAPEYTYYEVPFTSFIGHGSYIAMRLNRIATAQYVYLDDVELDLAASCPRPDTLAFDSASSNSIQLSWYEAGEATQWAVEYGPVGFVPGTGTSVIANTNPYTLTGLTPATTYQYYVRSICGVGDTSRYSRVPVTFSTAQLPGMLPYVYNFEDQNEWNNWQTNSNQAVNWFRGTAEHFDGNYGMYISADNGATCGTNMSAIVNACAYRDIDFGNDPTATYSITFKAKVGGTVAHNYDGVSVLIVDPSVPVEASSTAITSPWGHVNDVALGTVRRDTNWNTYTYHFDHQEGVRRVVFYWFNQATGVADFSGSPAAIDSVYVYQEACDRPYDLNASNITSNSATLNWSADANGTYIVAHRVNGEAASTTVYDTVVNQLSYNLTGLSSNTQYVFWVKRVCDAANSSDWSASRTFTTACSYFSASDTLFEDFRSVPGVAYNIDGSLPTCWEGYTNGVNTYSMPHVVNSGTYWYSLGDSNALIMTSGAATSYGDTKIVRLPLFVEPVNTLTLSYWMCTESSTNGVLSVGYMTGDNYETDFVPVKSIAASTATVKGSSGPQTGHGIFDTVTFEEVPATAQYIAFRWVYNTSFYSCCIDNVKVTSEGCSAPAMVSETHTYDSITVNWAGAGSLYMINIKESTEAGWPDADTLSNVTSYTFTGLQSGTSYQIRLRQYCSYSDEWSEWVYYTISTDTLPCFAPDGLHTTALTNATATMDWNVNGVESNWDIHVWFTGGLDTLYRVSSHPVTVEGFTAGITYNAAVRALCGNTLEEGDWSDTITFTTPTCPDVTGLVTSDVTSNSVTLSWDADAAVQRWVVEYGYAGFTQGQGISDTVTSNTYVVTGLASETSYEFKVLAICGYDWYSEQWAEISATTLASSGDDCDPVTNLTVSDITVNSAKVTWFSENGSAWNVVVPEANVDVTVTEQQYALTGLLANTNYNVKVRTICDNDQYSDFVTTSFMTEQVEGIDGVETMNCTIYPNPTSNATTISVSGVNGKVKIAIVDMNGRIVASETMECASDCVKTMDVENLAQGAYFVRITGESVNMVKKLVVR